MKPGARLAHLLRQPSFLSWLGTVWFLLILWPFVVSAPFGAVEITLYLYGAWLLVVVTLFLVARAGPDDD